MKINKIIRFLFKKFPSKNVCMKDYIGKQFGDQNEDIKSILFCLDLEMDSLEYAIKNNVNLIITHHPFFFGKKKDVLEKLEFKREIYELALKHKITVYSFHTNFDNSPIGMNTSILEMLGLKNIHVIVGFPCLAVGDLERKTDIKEFVTFFQNKTGYKNVNLLNYGPKEIKHIGVIGGAGSETVLSSKELKLDLFISGDVQHHTRREIMWGKLNYLDVPHEIENAFQIQMGKLVKEEFPDLKIYSFKEEYLLNIK